MPEEIELHTGDFVPKSHLQTVWKIFEGMPHYPRIVALQQAYLLIQGGAVMLTHSSLKEELPNLIELGLIISTPGGYRMVNESLLKIVKAMFEPRIVCKKGYVYTSPVEEKGFKEVFPTA